VNTTSSLLTYNYHSDLAKFQRGGIAREFNNKWLYISAAGLFEIGSAISGAAPTMSVLVFGRVLAGIGGSGIYVGTVNILTHMTMPVERAQYLGFVGMAWSFGTM
jgi:MFS family permease